MTSNPDHENDDRLEGRLRASLPPLPDAGFSCRVLATLPPPAAAYRTSRRPAFVAAGALAGLACAVLAGSSGSDSATEASAAALARALSALADPLLLSALVVAGVSLLYAFHTGVPRRPTA